MTHPDRLTGMLDTSTRNDAAPIFQWITSFDAELIRVLINCPAAGSLVTEEWYRKRFLGFLELREHEARN